MTTADTINRNAWAQLVAELIQSQTRGKKAPFARLIGVDTRSLDRWLKCEVKVSEESVRDVARAFNLNPMDLLVAVGYYQVAEVAPPTPVDPRLDPVIQRILADPTWTEEEKIVLVQRELDRIERERQQRLADYEWYLRQRNAAS